MKKDMMVCKWTTKINVKMTTGTLSLPCYSSMFPCTHLRCCRPLRPGRENCCIETLPYKHDQRQSWGPHGHGAKRRSPKITDNMWYVFISFWNSQVNFCVLVIKLWGSKVISKYLPTWECFHSPEYSIPLMHFNTPRPSICPVTKWPVKWSPFAYRILPWRVWEKGRERRERGKGGWSVRRKEGEKRRKRGREKGRVWGRIIDTYT